MGADGRGIPAVILAAGMGSRFTGGKFPKPLVRFLGLTLLERALLTCRKAGIEKFYVVVGFSGDEVRAHAEELKGRYGFDLEVVENERWERGNGTSVLAASPFLKGKRFLLTMCDHVFADDQVRRFLERACSIKTSSLAVDRRVSSIFDIDDATKVFLDESGYIRSIGKEIEEYNAIDMGVFLCNDEFIDALREAEKRGRGNCTITDGIRVLAERSAIMGVDVGDGFWIDLDTKDSMEYARRRLLKGSSKKGDGFISTLINRKISRVITEHLLEKDISPNVISIFSFLICLLGAFFISLGGYIPGVLGGGLVQFSSIVDGCDGEVARLKLCSTPFGGWLDTLLDRYADVAVVVGASWAKYAASPGYGVVLWSILAASGFILVSYARKECALRFGNEPSLPSFYALGRRDFRLFGVFVGSIFGRIFGFIVILGLLSHLLAVSMILSVRRDLKR